MRVAFCTIVAKHNIALARVTARSFSAFHPEIPFFVFLIDENDGFLIEDAFAYLAELDPPDFARLRFQYNAQELAYASTPLILEHLLDLGYEVSCFVKQESMFFGHCKTAISQCASQAITLAASHISPVPTDLGPRRELTTLLSGVYNAGFIGVTDCTEARSFLTWWRDRLSDSCYLDVAEGLHFEQRWLDLVPSYFPNAGVIRDPGFNIGHWCLPDRIVRIEGDAITADGQACSLVRFSGYDFDHPERVTRHFDRLSVGTLGPAAKFFHSYHAALQAENYPTTRHWPYSYGFFSNAVPVPLIARRIYSSMKDGRQRFDDPLAVKPNKSFFRWLNDSDEPAKAKRPRLTRLWRAVYLQRPDVQKAFPDIDGVDRHAYVRWTAAQGTLEHGIDKAFICA